MLAQQLLVLDLNFHSQLVDHVAHDPELAPKLRNFVLRFHEVFRAQVSVGSYLLVQLLLLFEQKVVLLDLNLQLRNLRISVFNFLHKLSKCLGNLRDLHIVLVALHFYLLRVLPLFFYFCDKLLQLYL